MIHGREYLFKHNVSVERISRRNNSADSIRELERKKRKRKKYKWIIS